MWAALELWQYIIISVIALFLMTLIGIFCAYLIIRFIYKDSRFPFLKLPLLLFRRNPGPLIFGNRAQQTTYTPSPRAKVSGPLRFPIPELYTEIEHNHKIATEFSNGNLLPLQTSIWDTRQHLAHELPTHIQSTIEQVYTNIKMLNKLVWLAKELDSQSDNLDDYKKLLAYIAKQIDIIKEEV